jgi:hypothetical protein
MLLIMEPVGQRQDRSEAEGRQLYADMRRFADDLAARGLLTVAESLQSDAAGVRVQVRDGKASLVDGPFSEAKEMVGGFFLLNCATKEQAVEIARQCPAAAWATVEVRGLGPCYE